MHVDKQVYKRNQCFRMAFCSKPIKDPEDARFKIPLDHWNDPSSDCDFVPTTACPEMDSEALKDSLINHTNGYELLVIADKLPHFTEALGILSGCLTNDEGRRRI